MVEKPSVLAAAGNEWERAPRWNAAAESKAAAARRVRERASAIALAGERYKNWKVTWFVRKKWWWCFPDVFSWPIVIRSLPSNHSNGLSYCSLLHSAAREIRNWPLIAFFYIAASNTYIYIKLPCTPRRTPLSLSKNLSRLPSFSRESTPLCRKKRQRRIGHALRVARWEKSGLETFCLLADVWWKSAPLFRSRKGFQFDHQKTRRAGCIPVTFKAFSRSRLQGGIAVSIHAINKASATC